MTPSDILYVYKHVSKKIKNRWKGGFKLPNLSNLPRGTPVSEILRCISAADTAEGVSSHMRPWTGGNWIEAATGCVLFECVVKNLRECAQNL